jgi:YidC/Oxa1 family membrane protein insertase
MDKRSLIFVIILSLSFFFIQQWFSPSPQKAIKKIETTVEKPFNELKHEKEEEVTQKVISNGKEEFYVLENEYMQVVFSTTGGAVSEINLPFASKDNKKSVVNPIETDRIIEQTSPYNDHFPSQKYYGIENNHKKLFDKGKLGGYYPLLRRSIFHADGSVAINIPKEYYAFNFVNENSNIEKTHYSVSHFDKSSITFTSTIHGRSITKKYSLAKNGEIPYCLDLNISTQADLSNIWITSGVLEVELTPNVAQDLKYRYFTGKKYSVDNIKLPKSASTNNTITPDWVSSANGFFGVILDNLGEPPQGYKAKNISGAIVPTRYTLVDHQHNLHPAVKYPGYEVLLPLGKNTDYNFRVYAGPYQGKLLKLIDKTYNNPLVGYNPEYIEAKSSQGFFTFITTPFANLLFILMNFFHLITSSWGFSIILLTVVLRVMLYPLNTWAIRSNMRLQEVAPQTKLLKERYKHDPKKLQQETIKLYKDVGANPLTGCFPILIQMPFLFGMFSLLRTTFELRGVSFIPGWINNLTAPDVLFSWDYPIFFFGTQFHLLPILLGVCMFAQQKMTTKTPSDGKALTDQQKQQKMMMYIMPVVFAVISYNLASGLNIYWFFSTILGIAQQALMTKMKNKKALLSKKKLKS